MLALKREKKKNSERERERERERELEKRCSCIGWSSIYVRWPKREREREREGVISYGSRSIGGQVVVLFIVCRA